MSAAGTIASQRAPVCCPPSNPRRRRCRDELADALRVGGQSFCRNTSGRNRPEWTPDRHFVPHTLKRRFGDFRFHMPPEQGIEHLRRAPSLLPDPAESKIIRIIRVVEKVQLLEAVQDVLHRRSHRQFRQACPAVRRGCRRGGRGGSAFFIRMLRSSSSMANFCKLKPCHELCEFQKQNCELLW